MGWFELDARFRAAGLGSVMNMTLAQVRGYGRALALIETEKLKAAAVAVRAGMADEKSWKAWLKSAP